MFVLSLCTCDQNEYVVRCGLLSVTKLLAKANGTPKIEPHKQHDCTRFEKNPRERKSKCCLSSSKKARLKDLRKHRNRAADTRWKECGGVECCTRRAVLPLRNAPREKTNKDNSFMLTSATERSDWIKYQICKRVEHLKAACLVNTGCSASG